MTKGEEPWAPRPRQKIVYRPLQALSGTLAALAAVRQSARLLWVPGRKPAGVSVVNACVFALNAWLGKPFNSQSERARQGVAVRRKAS